MIISIVQDGPVFNNKKQTIQKTIELVGQAKKGGADLVVFGETWLCGYPVWIDICRDAALWDHEPVKSIWADMYNSAIDLSSRDLDKLKKVVTDEKIWAVMGMNEKITKGPGNGTLFNAVLIISDKGEIVNHHRKIIFEELDLSVNTKEKMNLAVSGHYFRPDVFELKIDKSRSF